jgi:CRP/FNR family transcriptional regulator, anaerobic regulatory protein
MSNSASHPIAPATSTVVSLNSLRSHCATCSMRALCLPVGLTETDVAQLDAVLGNRLRLKKGDALFRHGAAFTALYAVKLGSLKTTVLSDDGREQVAGYHMPGDMLGLDGVGDDRHGCEAIALEDSELCVIPFGRVEELARHVPALQHNLHKVLSREIERDHGVMLLLGSMRAEERLAAFLLNLSERYKCRGYSSTEFVLRMTREEIGSYLGLKLETVSRLFSKFQEEGLVQVSGRSVKLNDLAMLKQLVGLL